MFHTFINILHYEQLLTRDFVIFVDLLRKTLELLNLPRHYFPKPRSSIISKRHTIR